jgi:hypothetical protein
VSKTRDCDCILVLVPKGIRRPEPEWFGAQAIDYSGRGDTGCDRTIIDSTFSQSLLLKSSGTALVERNYSTEEHVTATAERVRIGSKTWSSVPLELLDLMMLSRVHMASISGVLGTDLLTGMTTRFSYSIGVAEVVDDIETCTLPIALDRVRKLYFAPVIIDETPVKMLLDSGTNLTALSSSGWRSLPLSSGANQTIEGIQSSGSPTGALLACIPSIQVGDAVLHDSPLRVMQFCFLWKLCGRDFRRDSRRGSGAL